MPPARGKGKNRRMQKSKHKHTRHVLDERVALDTVAKAVTNNKNKSKARK